MTRLRELDFLRGVAILLVLLRHAGGFSFTKNMGWIGVDLFFIISGFLVSGLLFKEYLTFGDIKPARFLIRRGFKIYPIYFLFYILYLIPILIKGNSNIRGLLADLTFTQNYVWGWGYAYPASWSLAVEEHFYFGFSLVLWLGLKYKKIALSKETGTTSFEKSMILALVACFFLRVLSNLLFPLEQTRNFTMSHLRMDSLLAGVYISYMYHFKSDHLESLFTRYKVPLIVLACVGLAWTPFIDPVSSFFVKTFGFTFLYISFGILLMYFLLAPSINQKLNNAFGYRIVNAVSKIGFCSYSIYIIHTFVNVAFDKFIASNSTYAHYFGFVVTSILSIVLGFLMTNKIERKFLAIRDEYFPGRA